MNIEVRMATKKDRLAIENLHDEVHFTMQSSGLEQEYFMPYIDDEGRWRDFETADCAVAYYGTQIIGVCGAILHGSDLFGYASKMGIHPDKLGELFIYTHPDFRSLSNVSELKNRRISTELVDKALDYMSEQERKIALVTTHPEHPVKKHILRMGFSQFGEEFMARKKYQRILMCKKVDFRPTFLKIPETQKSLSLGE